MAQKKPTLTGPSALTNIGSEGPPVLTVQALVNALSQFPGLSRVRPLATASDCELIAEDAEGNRAHIIVFVTETR